MQNHQPPTPTNEAEIENHQKPAIKESNQQKAIVKMFLARAMHADRECVLSKDCHQTRVFDHSSSRQKSSGEIALQLTGHYHAAIDNLQYITIHQ